MLTKEQALRLVRLDPETGKLYWVFNYQRPDRIGQEAGYFNNGYWRLSLSGKTYYRAQIVWLIITGEFPDDTVDHKDTNKLNDKPNNLRLASKGQNAMNSKAFSHNTSGYRGVSFSSAAGRWRADIQINGNKQVLGYFDDPQDAHAAWKAAAIKAFGEEFVRVE